MHKNLTAMTISLVIPALLLVPTLHAMDGKEKDLLAGAMESMRFLEEDNHAKQRTYRNDTDQTEGTPRLTEHVLKMMTLVQAADQQHEVIFTLSVTPPDTDKTAP